MQSGRAHLEGHGANDAMEAIDKVEEGRHDAGHDAKVVGYTHRARAACRSLGHLLRTQRLDEVACGAQRESAL